MKKILFCAVVAMLASSCSQKSADGNKDTASISLTPVNALTEEQTAQGWKLLFDGKTMNGWRPFKNNENNSWEIQDESLHCKSAKDSAANKRADLITVDQYENFEFSFDWKIAPANNSGVMFHVTEDFDVPYASGPEYQVIDDIGYEGESKPENKSAGNYAMHVPENKKLNPAGEWNSSRIVVSGSHVEHWLNGGKVLEYELWSDDWKQRVANSKWSKYPGYGLTKKGHLALQDHDGEVWYRNLMVREL